MHWLERAERHLRSYDKALRLRRAHDDKPELLVERKTFRGRYGSIGPGGLVWLPDSGRRREEGHVLVCSVPRDIFVAADLLDTLRAADLWRTYDQSAEPEWRRVERADDRIKQQRINHRRDFNRYKASEIFDRYVWKHKQRVSVPVKVN
jgi:hypothetical protein